MYEPQPFFIFDGAAPTLHCLLMGAYFPWMIPGSIWDPGQWSKV